MEAGLDDMAEFKMVVLTVYKIGKARARITKKGARGFEERDFESEATQVKMGRMDHEPVQELLGKIGKAGPGMRGLLIFLTSSQMDGTGKRRCSRLLETEVPEDWSAEKVNQAMEAAVAGALPGILMIDDGFQVAGEGAGGQADAWYLSQRRCVGMVMSDGDPHWSGFMVHRTEEGAEALVRKAAQGLMATGLYRQADDGAGRWDDFPGSFIYEKYIQALALRARAGIEKQELSGACPEGPGKRKARGPI